MGDQSNELAAYLAYRDLPCPGCKYSLRALTANQCPECGRSLCLGDFYHPESEAWHKRRNGTILRLFIVGWGFGVFGFSGMFYGACAATRVRARDRADAGYLIAFAILLAIGVAALFIRRWLRRTPTQGISHRFYHLATFLCILGAPLLVISPFALLIGIVNGLTALYYR